MPDTLSFGIHRGKNIKTVPLGYLEWAAKNFKGATLRMVEDELHRRGEATESKSPGEGPSVSKLARYSRQEFAEQLMKVIMKMPEGLNEQTVQANGYEIRIKKIF